MKTFQLVCGILLFILSTLLLIDSGSVPFILKSLSFQHYSGIDELLSLSVVGIEIVYAIIIISLSYATRFILLYLGRIQEHKSEKNIDAGCFVRMQRVGIVVFLMTLFTLGISGSAIGLILLIIMSISGYIDEAVKPNDAIPSN